MLKTGLALVLSIILLVEFTKINAGMVIVTMAAAYMLGIMWFAWS